MSCVFKSNTQDSEVICDMHYLNCAHGIISQTCVHGLFFLTEYAEIDARLRVKLSDLLNQLIIMLKGLSCRVSNDVTFNKNCPSTHYF
jgi:hypothetical protein